MKLIFPVFYSALFGSSMCTARNLLRSETNENKHDERRVLQGLPPVVGQEIGIIGTVIPQLDLELSKFETTLAVRFTNYYGAMFWNCVAAYSTTYMDSLTKVRPSVVVTDSNLHSSANRGLCAAQSAVTYSALSMPGAVDNAVAALTGIGIAVDDDLDAAVAACSDDACLQALAANQGFDGVTMGHIIAKQVYDFSLTDGWNQLGTDDGCVVNCRPYRDVTGYAPQNSPYGSQNGNDDGNGNGKGNGNGNSNGNGNGNGNGNSNGNSGNINIDELWQPLLEDNGKGYFNYQEHVTPQVGQTAAFRYIPESNRANRVAYNPGYSSSRSAEASAVIARMSTLDDVKKIQIEMFDNKLIVVGTLFDAFVGKTLTDGYVDTELGQPGLILSYERFVHFAQTIVAADYDAVVIAWKEKVNFDLVRPTTVIKNQGSNTMITTWAPGGTQTYPASDFEAYIRVMPHSEYVSGSACLFQTQEEAINGYLTAIGLDPTSYPIVFPTVNPGDSIVEPSITPSSPITLTYPNVAAMNIVGSASRLDGGMHFEESVPAAKDVCSGIAGYAITGSFNLY